MGQFVTGDIGGLEVALQAAYLPPDAASAIKSDLQSLGAVDVSEMQMSDWTSLPSLIALKPMEKRRLVAAVYG